MTNSSTQATVYMLILLLGVIAGIYTERARVRHQERVRNSYRRR